MTAGLDSWFARIALLLVLAGVGLRIAAASRTGLWADEIFSLAMATGHSLEHPAAEADTTLGDFVEPRDPVPAGAFARYVEQETPPAGARRVVHAVLLSDTNPPLYYLLLNPWTRLFGTGDAALRLFSAWWAVLSLPLIWLIGRQVGDGRTARSATVLFALSPLGLYYSAEGRMYALLLFTSLALVWATLRLSREAGGVRDGILWVAAGVAGLLIHYFFAFVWLACAAWLVLRTRGGRRRTVLALAALAMLAVLPWYLEVPTSLGQWRVTAGWLDGDLPWPGALWRPVELAIEMLAGRSYLGGWQQAQQVVEAIVLILAAVLLARRRLRWLFEGDRLLLWACAAASCTGPLAFDILMGTTTTTEPRYVLPALPALILILAASLSHAGTRVHAALLAVVLLAWLPGLVDTAFPGDSTRPWQPYPEIARRLETRLDPEDLVFLSSTPSGVIGVARYLDADVSVVAWVQQLGTRQPDDAARLAAGHRRVALAEVTHLGRGSLVRSWLEEHGRQVAQDTFPSSSSEIAYFVPASGDVFGSGVEN